MNEERPCVSKRNHVTSLDLLIEDLLEGWNGHAYDSRESLETLLKRFGQILITRVSWDFAKGATRGIEQMANLIQDPDYYETKQKRRKGEKRRQAEYQSDREREHYRRRFEPTPQEVAHDIADSLRSIEYHSKAISAAQVRLAELRALEAELPVPVDLSDCATETIS